MDLILANPGRLTPRMLFELYVHPDNLVRTLAQGFLTKTKICEFFDLLLNLKCQALILHDFQNS